MATSSRSYTSPSGVHYRGGGQFGRVPRAGKVDFSVRFQANTVLRLVRDIEGKFQPANGAFLKAVEAAHIHMAMTAQAGMVEDLKRSVERNGRPQERFGRTGKSAHKAGALMDAIRDPDNRFVNASGFLVGRPSYLDQSPAARYWRRIEEGGPAFMHKGWFFLPGGQGFAVPGAPDPGAKHKMPTGRVRAFAPSNARQGMDARFPGDFDNPRAFWVQISAFEGYHFGRGAAKAFGRLDLEAIYVARLSEAGIRVTPRMMRSWSPTYVS